MTATQNIPDYKALYEELQLRYDNLSQQLAQLQKMVFGSKHERFVPTNDNNPSPQLSLELDADTIATCKITDVKKLTVTRTSTKITPHPPKPHPGRMKLPASLRRKRPCCCQSAIPPN